MLAEYILLFSTTFSITLGQSGKCDQTPQLATTSSPTEDTEGLFHLKIENAKQDDNGDYLYTTAQTYVLAITAVNATRPFRWFMITAEDPEVDNSNYEFSYKNIDVGTLKTLDTQARYSERCYSSVEHVDYSEKTQVEIHWVSPSQNNKDQTVRIRGMVAENSEVWYTGNNLTVVLHKDTSKPLDSPPLAPVHTCNLCSEARYEVIFKGEWSRVKHPRHYPSKPDENGYTHMVGASHDSKYVLWEQGSKASPGLCLLVEEAKTEELEKEIISQMAPTSGTRTLIRGKRRHHPYMSEPSHSLFRADRFHHLFSLVLGLRPSPDWFLGASNFELCDVNNSKWLEKATLPLYPWDAGTVDGISYESMKPKTTTKAGLVERVQMGSFVKASPFYQINLNELEPFGHLYVNRLDVYPLVGVDCNDLEETAEDKMNEELEGMMEKPVVAESLQQPAWGRCYTGEWKEWSPCTPERGDCGSGFRTRTRSTETSNDYIDYQDDIHQNSNMCKEVQEQAIIQHQNCFVEC